MPLRAPQRRTRCWARAQRRRWWRCWTRPCCPSSGEAGAGWGWVGGGAARWVGGGTQPAAGTPCQALNAADLPLLHLASTPDHLPCTALASVRSGAVTFSTGVGLKMAVSRLTHWAADCGVKEDKLPQVGGWGWSSHPMRGQPPGHRLHASTAPSCWPATCHAIRLLLPGNTTCTTLPCAARTGFHRPSGLPPVPLPARHRRPADDAQGARSLACSALLACFSAAALASNRGAGGPGCGAAAGLAAGLHASHPKLGIPQAPTIPRWQPSPLPPLQEVLTDQAIRREVVPGLPLHRICQLLERFQPDDCAPDPLPPGLLEALQGESPRSEGGSTPSPTSKADDEYAPPAEALLLADGAEAWRGWRRRRAARAGPRAASRCGPCRRVLEPTHHRLATRPSRPHTPTPLAQAWWSL